MNDRAVSVFEQYDLEIESTKKIRGAIVAKTNKGLAALWEYSGKTDKLKNYKEICDYLFEKDYPYTDNIIANKEDALFSTDFDGKNYVVKEYYEGRECDVYNVEDCCFLVKKLAMLHNQLEAGNLLENEEVVVRDFSKRETELNRVRSFMRKRSQKGNFEMDFLKEYPYFCGVANEAMDILDANCLERLTNLVKSRGMICHGDANQHNILISEEHILATHFEKACRDIQIVDLYLFLRKVLEKNMWSYDLCVQILDAYMNQKELDADEKKYLYARLLYPERFWKIANAYLNKRKSLPPRRQMEKLQALKEAESFRRKFLEQLENDLL